MFFKEGSALNDQLKVECSFGFIVGCQLFCQKYCLLNFAIKFVCAKAINVLNGPEIRFRGNWVSGHL
jgi:hypothetical protein